MNQTLLNWLMVIVGIIILIHIILLGIINYYKIRKIQVKE